MSDTELSGLLGSPVLDELVRIIEDAHRSGVLALSRGCQRGVLDFQSGTLVGAAVDGLAGLSAAYELMAWSTGKYHFRPNAPPEGGPLDTTPEILKMEVRRRLEMRRPAFDGVAALDAKFSMDDLAMLGGATALRKDDLALLDWMDGERILEQVISLSGLADEAASHSLRRLREEGLIRFDSVPALGSAKSHVSAPAASDEIVLSGEDLDLMEILDDETADDVSVPKAPIDASDPDMLLDELLTNVKQAVDALPEPEPAAPPRSNPLVRARPSSRRRAGGVHPDLVSGAPSGSAISARPGAKPDRPSLWRWLLSFFLWSDDAESDATGSPPQDEPLTPEEEAFLAGEMIRIRAPWADARPVPSLDPTGLREQLRTRLLGEKEVFPTDADTAFLDRLIVAFSSDELNLPIFPDAARKLDKLLRQGEPSIADAVEIVKREPDMVRRVWKAASHAAYAHRVSSLDHAVVRIGLDKLWRIGMSAFLYSPLFRVRGFTAAAERVRNVSIVAAEVASWLSNESTGDTYVAGLLHEVGRLFVFRAAVTRPGGLAPSPDVVEWVADHYYPWFSVIIAQCWGLSDGIQSAVGFHPDPSHAAPGAEELAIMVQVGQIAGHTVVANRRQRDCGGEEALERIDGVTFDLGKTLERANEALDGLYDLASVA